MNDESVANIVKDIDCIQETQQHSVTIEHSWSIRDICDLISSKRPGEKIESEQFSYSNSDVSQSCKHCQCHESDGEESNFSIIPSSYSLDFELACQYFIKNSAWRLEITKSDKDLNSVKINAILLGIVKSNSVDEKILRTIEQLSNLEYELYLKIKFSILNDKLNEIFDKNLLEIKLDLKKCLQQLTLRQSKDFSSSKKTFLIEQFSIDNFFQTKNFLNWLNSRKSDDFCVITEFKLYRKSLSKPNETPKSKIKSRLNIDKFSQTNRVNCLLILDYKHAWTIKNWRNYLMAGSTSHTFLNEFEISNIFSHSNQADKLLNEFGEEFESSDPIVPIENIKFGKFRSKLFSLIESQKNKTDHDCPDSKFNFDKNKIDSLLKEVKWKLQLYPNGYSQDYENNLSLFVNFSQLTGELSNFAPNSKNKSFNSTFSSLNSCKYFNNQNVEETFYDSNEDYGFILLIKSSSLSGDSNEASEKETERKSRKKVHSCETFVKASFQISILDSNGKKVDKCQSEKQLFELFGSWGYKEYMNVSDLVEMKEKYLTNSNLNLNCKIVLFYTVTTKIPGSSCIDIPLLVRDDKLQIRNSSSSPSENSSSSESKQTKENVISLREKAMVKQIKKKKSSHKLNGYCNTLVYDLRRLLLQSDMSDLTIQAPVRSIEELENNFEENTNFKEFKVHKLILSSRSEVFFKMFNCDNLTNKINTLCIRDFDSYIVDIFLNYLYTDELEINFKDFRVNLSTCDPNLKEMADFSKDLEKKNCEENENDKNSSRKELLIHVFTELFKIADKYCVNQLKIVCENQLTKFINEDNTIELLVVSYLHNSVKLKKKCFKYLAENVTKVIKKPNWEHLEKNYPGLLAEAFKVLFYKEKEDY